MKPTKMSPALPKVSIVIPVYNGSQFLKEAIDSALSQTYPILEIIVVNDGSDDRGKTEAIALGYGDKIKYFTKENGGVASALNLAIREMTGEYFSWLSHDDLYYPEKIERQIAVLRNLGEDKVIIYSDYALFAYTTNLLRPVRLEGVVPKQFRYWLTVSQSLHGCSLLIPKKAFEECGLFDESLVTTQDYDLWFRMAEIYRFIHLPDLLVKSRQHQNQGSNTMSDIAMREGEKLFINFIKQLTAEEVRSGAKKSVEEGFCAIADIMHKRQFNVAAKAALERAGSGYKNIVINACPMSKQEKVKIWGVSLLKFLLPTSFFIWLRWMLIKLNILNGEIDFTDHAFKRKLAQVYDTNLSSAKAAQPKVAINYTETEIIRRELPTIIDQLSVKTFVDAPCGDWHLMEGVDLGVEHYIGCDIVTELIEANRRQFANETRNFIVADLSRDILPKTDMIFSRDLFSHLTFDEAFKIIANFKKAGAKYLLTITFDYVEQNDELGTSLWRPLNLQKSPFSFPPPLFLIKGQSLESGGALAVWLLKDIPLPKEWY